MHRALAGPRGGRSPDSAEGRAPPQASVLRASGASDAPSRTRLAHPVHLTVPVRCTFES
jgi:hypothetical protein